MEILTYSSLRIESWSIHYQYFTFMSYSLCWNVVTFHIFTTTVFDLMSDREVKNPLRSSILLYFNKVALFFSLKRHVWLVPWLINQKINFKTSKNQFDYHQFYSVYSTMSKSVWLSMQKYKILFFFLCSSVYKHVRYQSSIF